MQIESATTRVRYRRAMPLLVIVVLAVLGYVVFGDDLNFETLRENRAELLAYRDAHYLLSVLAFMAAYVSITALSLPGAAIASLTGGFLFGLAPGTLFSVTSATIGATLIFLAARQGFGEILSRKLDNAEGRMRQFREGLRENELSFLFLMRLVPAVPFFAANLIPALVGVRTSRFVFTTFFGIIPGGIVYTWIGTGLGEVFSRGQTPDLSILFEPHIIGPILALCLLAALPVALKLLRKTR